MEVISYTQLMKQKEEKISQLINDTRMFFAFSNEQFQSSKTKLEENEKYISLGSGTYIPEFSLPVYKSGMKEILAWERNMISEQKMEEVEILYQLNNYECFYIYDYSEVVEMFKGTYTEEQIQKVFNDNIDKYD